MFIQLIYASVPITPDTVVLDFVPASKKANDSMGITGLLVSDSSAYLQVLEGEQDVVDKLYAKIKADYRHKNVELIRYDSISYATRQFKSWGMRHVKLPKNIKLECLSVEEKISVLYKTADAEIRRKFLGTIAVGLVAAFALVLATFTFGPKIEQMVFPPFINLIGTVVKRSENTTQVLVTGNRDRDRYCTLDSIHARSFLRSVRQDSSTKILEINGIQNDRFVVRLLITHPEVDLFDIEVWSTCVPLWHIKQIVQVPNIKTD